MADEAVNIPLLDYQVQVMYCLFAALIAFRKISDG
jgi:hypothetical protein